MGVRGDLRNVRASGPGKRTPTPRSGRCGGLGTRSGIFVSYHTGAVREDELGDDGGAEGSLESLLTILEDGECESVGYRVRADHLSDEAADAELGDAATPPAHLATVAVVGDGM